MPLGFAWPTLFVEVHVVGLLRGRRKSSQKLAKRIMFVCEGGVLPNSQKQASQKKKKKKKLASVRRPGGVSSTVI